MFALLGFILLFRLGAAPIYILDEAKNAEAAREMLHSHNLVVPTFNGELRTDKPPLHYFFMTGAYKIFGENEFAARFFSVIMGLFTVWVTYFYTKKLFNHFTAFCAALVLVSSTHFLFEFRLAVPDPYLIFFITLGLFSAYSWLEKNEILQLYISAASLAFATLAKGPVALALPGICILLWIIIQKKWKEAFTWHLIPAALLLLIIAAPWYIEADKATNGEWTKGFFIDNNLNRFSDTKEDHGGFFIITLVFVLAGLLPYIVFTGEIIRQRKKIFFHPLVKFSAIVVATFIIFFSISSTKLPNYPMPCYPFAAVVLGNFMALLFDKVVVSKKYPFLIIFVITLLIPVAGYFAIGQETATKDDGWLGLVLLITPLIFLIPFIQKTGWQTAILILAAGYFIFNLIGLTYVYPALYSKNPVAKTIDVVRKYPDIYYYNIFNPGYRFYLDKNIPGTSSVDTLKAWLKTSPGAIVISRTDYLDSLKPLPLKEIARHHDIFELPVTVILKTDAKP